MLPSMMAQSIEGSEDIPSLCLGRTQDCDAGSLLEQTLALSWLAILPGCTSSRAIFHYHFATAISMISSLP